jgi:glucosamine--fructose-6-phosphate aminotransferase (isomerizing)
MCGIIGYIGKRNINEVILKGLERLEYRGYDSCSITVIENNQINIHKTVGRIQKLKEIVNQKPFKGTIGIGHTRWATHGIPNEINAHPQFDCKKQIAVIHNGIIENYHALRQWLINHGHIFVSQTDTEVIPHLIEQYYQGDLLTAVQHALKLIEGTYGLAIISNLEPDRIVIARNGSPLILGICPNNEYIVASDASAIIDLTRKVTYLADGELAIVSSLGHRITNLAN